MELCHHHFWLDCEILSVTIYSNLFLSGHYLIQSLQLMSAACCAGCYRHINKFTIIYFMTELFQKDLLGSVHFT